MGVRELCENKEQGRVASSKYQNTKQLTIIILFLYNRLLSIFPLLLDMQCEVTPTRIDPMFLVKRDIMNKINVKLEQISGLI